MTHESFFRFMFYTHTCMPRNRVLDIAFQYLPREVNVHEYYLRYATILSSLVILLGYDLSLIKLKKKKKHLDRIRYGGESKRLLNKLSGGKP